MARILIVEDEFIISKLYEMALNKEQHKIVGVAHTILEAKKFLKNEEIDVVLLDLRLKNGEYGLDLIDEIKKRNLPVVVITGNDDRQTREELNRHGISQVLSKPVDLKILTGVIKKLSSGANHE